MEQDLRNNAYGTHLDDLWPIWFGTKMSDLSQKRQARFFHFSPSIIIRFSWESRMFFLWQWHDEISENLLSTYSPLLKNDNANRFSRFLDVSTMVCLRSTKNQYLGTFLSFSPVGNVLRLLNNCGWSYFVSRITSFGQPLDFAIQIYVVEEPL